MTINYNVTGKERKALVEAISQITGEKSVYKAAPTFVYEIGEWFTVDKNGALIGSITEKMLDTLADMGFIGSIANAAPAHETELPDNIADPYDGEPPTGLAIEYPLDGVTDKTLDNLHKLIAAKATLLKAAIGAEELPVIQLTDRLQFPWFPFAEGEQANAYACLITRLCATAKEKKRITAKEKDVNGSHKYAMRCFLLSLGMIGESYKTARKILLSKLEGSSAYAKTPK